MAFGVRETPGGEKILACPSCGAVFAATDAGKQQYLDHLKAHMSD